MKETPKAYDSKNIEEMMCAISHDRVIAKLQPILYKNCQRHPAACQGYNHHKIHPKTPNGVYWTFRKNPDETQINPGASKRGRAWTV